MNHLTRRQFLKGLGLSLAAGCFPCSLTLAATINSAPEQAATTLRAAAKRAGLYVGAAVQLRDLKNEPDFAGTLIRECNLVVPEGALKWNVVHPQYNQWNFNPANDLLAFAKAHGLRMRGHTLVWHEAFPDWAKNLLTQGYGLSLLEEHIEKVMGTYKGKLLSWDVVNEAINLKDGQQQGLRKSPWLKALGPDYIAHAYRIAARTDPTATLVYNDYMLTGEEGQKGAAILALVRSLLDKGVPLHAVGLQSHLWAPKTVDVPKISAFCREVKAMGLDLYITELDVGEQDYGSDFASRDKLVAQRVDEYLNAVFSECTPREILTWGLSTRHSWMKDPRYFKTNTRAEPVRGLPFDEDMQRTPFGDTLYKALSALPPAS